MNKTNIVLVDINAITEDSDNANQILKQLAQNAKVHGIDFSNLKLANSIIEHYQHENLSIGKIICILFSSSFRIDKYGKEKCFYYKPIQRANHNYKVYVSKNNINNIETIIVTLGAWEDLFNHPDIINSDCYIVNNWNEIRELVFFELGVKLCYGQ